MHRTDNDVIEITGFDLTLDKIRKVVFDNYKVSLRPEVYEKLREARKFIDKAVAEGEIYYGITTGFGAFVGKILSKRDAEHLQLNLLRSHATGVGSYADKYIARATLLIRLNTLARGNSGIRPEILNLIVAFLNKNVIPKIPTKGSVGASGDLAPLSHMALALIGDPSATIKYNEREYTGFELKRVLYEEIYRDIPHKENILPKHPNFEDREPLIKLSYKEGLALNNGTSFTAAILSIILIKLSQLVKLADISLSLTLESICGFIDAFEPILFRISDSKNTTYNSRYAVAHNIRLLTGYEDIEKGIFHKSRFVRSADDIIPFKDLIVAVTKNTRNNILGLSLDKEKLILYGAMDLEKIKNITRKVLERVDVSFHIKEEANLLRIDINTKNPHDLEKLYNFLIDLKNGNKSLKWREIGFIQDPYSIRCAPQVHGSAREALSWAKEVLEREINSSCDNPLIFRIGDNYKVISGGNFHGQTLALISDTIAIAVATLSNIIERRISLTLDPKFNKGLTPFLVGNELKQGLNSGLMLLQYTAASLAAENRALAAPFSVHSIPTSANQEDHVSMSTSSALRLLNMLENLKYIISIELITASQAIYLRAKLSRNDNLKHFLGPGAYWISNYILNLLKPFGGLPIQEDRYLKSHVDVVFSNLEQLYEFIERNITDKGYHLL